MTIRPPNRIVAKALFGFIKLRVKFSNITRKRLTPLSSIKLSIFNKAGIFILLSLMVISSKTYAEKINTEKFFNSKIGREVEVVEGEIIVRFKPRLETGAIRKMNEAFGNQLRKEIKNMNIHRIRLGKGKKIGDMLEMYRKDPNVLFAEPNYIARVLAITPNDPSFSQQWGLSKIYAPEAWDIEKGNSNGIIAIVDTGIDLDHPDLDEKIVPGYDFVNEDSGPMDDNGHGTHCAGIAAAESNNGQGITGVAWGSKLMPVKVLGSDGTGTYSDVAEGIIYAADNGAKVINLSLGAYSYSQTLQDAVDYAYRKGCVIVAAAGNDNTNEPLYPAAYGNVIGVAATDQNDMRWTSSNYGDYIDVCAPGVNIYSTFFDNVYISASGTSASAPSVSGLAALLFSQDLTLTNSDVKNKICQNADDLGTIGLDEYYGYGRVNLLKPLQVVSSSKHDLALIRLHITPVIFSVGQIVTINVEVKNEGEYAEHNVPVSVYLGKELVERTKYISSIQSGESQELRYSWTTSFPLLDYYLVKGEVSTVSGETDAIDNKKSVFLSLIQEGEQVTILYDKEFVHPWIMEKAINLVGQYSYSCYESLNNYKNRLKEGTTHEDGYWPYPRTVCHFYRPIDEAKLPEGPVNAYIWGSDYPDVYSPLGNYYDYNDAIEHYKNGNYSNAFYALGHVAHLIGDMSVPAHTHLDVHPGDDYEEYCKRHCPDYSNPEGPYIPWTTEKPLVEQNLKSFFDKMAWKSYNANRFYGKIRQDAYGVDPNSEFDRMFEVEFHKTVLDKWWELYNEKDMGGERELVGYYEHSLRSDDWWPCEGDTYNNYVENTDLAKPKIYVDCDGVEIDNSNNKWNLCRLFSQKLIPYAIRYASGLMIYFCDQVKPINCVILSPNAEGWYNGKITVSANAPKRWTSVGISKVEFQYSTNHVNWYNIGTDYSSSGGWSIDWNTSGINDGTVWVRARSCDNGGLYSDWDESNASFGVDNTPPTSVSVYQISETSPYAHTTGSNLYYSNNGNGSFSVKVQASDSHSGLDYASFPNIFSGSDGGNEPNLGYSNYKFEHTYYFNTNATASGTYFVTVYDNAGNPNQLFFTIVRDNSKPNPPTTVDIVDDPFDHWDNNNSVEITWAGASDNMGGSGIGGYKVQRDNDGWEDDPSTFHTFPNTSDGYHTFKVRSVDNVGNVSSSYKSDYCTVDTINPTVSNLAISGFSGSTYFDGTYTWYDQGSDSAFGFTSNPSDANPYHVDFTWDNSGGTGYSGGDYDDGCEEPGWDGDVSDVSGAGYSLSDDPDGTITLTVIAYDKVYRLGRKQLIIKFDNTAPKSSVSARSRYQNSLSFTVQWSGDDGNGCGLHSYDVQYKDGNGQWTDWLADVPSTQTSATFGPTSLIRVQNGHTYYFRCRAKDKLGNQESYPDSADTFTTIDLTPPEPPVVSSLTHKENQWNTINNDPIFNWTTPSDLSDIDGYSYLYSPNPNTTPDADKIDNDEGKWVEQSVTSASYFNIDDGIWYFHVRARDNAGNWGDPNHYCFKIDVTSPTFSAIFPSADPAKEGDITITVVASEAMSALSASVTQKDKAPALINMNSDDGVKWTGIYTVVSGYDGTAKISVSGKDPVGNEGSDLTTFVVDTIPPTKAQIYSTTHPKNIPTSNSNPSFTWADSTDSGGSGVAGYSYAVSEVESYDLDVATETTGTSASFTKQDGTWWFHLRGVDKAGNGSEIGRYKFIIDTTSPTFTASSSKDPAKEGNVTITVQASEKLRKAPTVNVKQNDQDSAKPVDMNSSDSITWIGTYTVVTEYDGAAIINVVSGVDLADNMGTGSGGFEVDTIEPTGSISVSPPPLLKTGEFEIELSIKDTSNIPQKPSLSYTPLGGSLISVPLTGSDKNWSGSSYIESTTPEGIANFSFSAIDAADNVGTTITSGETFEIDTTINFAEGGTSSNNDGTKVEVPKNAFSEDINIRITVLDPNLSIIREADNNLVDDKGINPIKTTNLYRSIIAIGESSGEIKRFDKPIAISIPYPDGDQNGVVDKTNIREASLRMFYLDENQAKWLLVPDSQVDPDGNNVTARVSHFSIYTIMQFSPASGLSEVFGYPNPCYVKRDGYVRISNIPLDAKQVKIYIYNVVGELVRTLEEGDGIETQAGSKIGKWDGRNENDEMVASGIYVYLIKSRGTKKTEKIAIFW